MLLLLLICYCAAILSSSFTTADDQLKYRLVNDRNDRNDANPIERKLLTAENSTTTKSSKKTLLQTLTSRKYDDVQLFYKIAMESSNPPTDKVTAHAFSEMYGLYLLPYIRAQHRDGKKIKFLEIGLGCKMGYGPGVSVKLWKNIFQPSDEIWEAEYEADCVSQARKENKLQGINVVTGDQGNFTDLNRWVKESGGNFDIVIDDGGHNHVLIRNSLAVLWPQVNSSSIIILDFICAQHNYIFDNFTIAVVLVIVVVVIVFVVSIIVVVVEIIFVVSIIVVVVVIIFSIRVSIS